MNDDLDVTLRFVLNSLTNSVELWATTLTFEFLFDAMPLNEFREHFGSRAVSLLIRGQ